jgi:hypothetical protein
MLATKEGDLDEILKKEESARDSALSWRDGPSGRGILAVQERILYWEIHQSKCGSTN